MPRLTGLGALGVLVLVLTTGCSLGTTSGSSGANPPDSLSASPSPTPTPTPSAIVWADGVCIARDRLGETLKDIALDLSIDPTSDVEATDQLMAQLQARSDEVDAAAAELGAALGRAPIDVETALGAVGDLQTAGDTFTTARDKAQTDLDAVQGADGILAFGRAVATAAVSTKAAYDAGVAYLHILDSVTKSTRTDLRAGFDSAPACQ